MSQKEVNPVVFEVKCAEDGTPLDARLVSLGTLGGGVALMVEPCPVCLREHNAAVLDMTGHPIPEKAAA